MKIKLFLDCDGVLADFDNAFLREAGHESRGYEKKFGTKAFWKVIREHPNFFGTLDLMPGARKLYDSVSHLAPTILTGVPIGDWSQPQKFSWRDRHFPGVDMITCRSKEKYKHMHEDHLNIIIDDWDEYKHVWEDNGGVFILHTDVDKSLEELSRYVQL